MEPEEINPWDYADPDEDLITDEEYDAMLEPQFISREVNLDISDEAKKALSNKTEPFREAKEAADFGRTFLDKETVYHMGGGHQLNNPLDGEAPYKLDNVSFVYWCYHKAGVPLNESPEYHTIQTIKNDPKLVSIGDIGSKLDPEDLTYGDLVLFKGDSHIGFYVGEGQFISWVGNGYNNYSGGLRLNTMKEGKWRNLFQGHVLRLKEGDTLVE